MKKLAIILYCLVATFSLCGQNATIINGHQSRGSYENLSYLVKEGSSLKLTQGFQAKAATEPGFFGRMTDGFITTWNAHDGTITIPVDHVSLTYDYTVTWIRSDGFTGKTGPLFSSATVSLPSSDTYTVIIEGEFPRIVFGSSTSSNRNKLLSIEQWGGISWQSMASAFEGCANLVINAQDSPDLSLVTDMSNMFKGANSFNQDIGLWDVSTVTDMSGLFYGASSFNQNIGLWEVSLVSDMTEMFRGASSFNRDISGWNVSNVTNMSGMFRQATSFDSPLNGWASKTSLVQDLSYMFATATSFNQSIDQWDVINVTDMSFMFKGASMFNSPLNGWGNKTANVEDMSEMFQESAFNQPVDLWDVSNVTSMTSMFRLSSFNSSLNSWGSKTASVVDMSYMFDGSDFNQPISTWDVSGVTDMSYMFYRTNFDQSLSDWSIVSLVNGNRMFSQASNFNQDLSGWNTASLADASAMFNGASAFDQNIGSWTISSITNMAAMFNNAGLSISNYDGTIQGWASQTVIPSGITLGALNLLYCREVERDLLVDSYGWSFDNDQIGCVSTIPLITVWKTDNLSTGSTANNRIRLPFYGSGTNYNIYWEEVGNSSNNGNYNSQGENTTITFSSPGTYRLEILGVLPGIDFKNVSNDNRKLLSIDQWGDNKWSFLEGAFYNCRNLNINATDSPNLENVTSTAMMFQYATSLDANIDAWDVQNIEDMSYMFFEASSFNQPLSSWDVSKVRYMQGMFTLASAFNQDLSTWATKVGLVEDMSSMFQLAGTFNQNISAWNVSSVQFFNKMFSSAGDFNQDLSAWDISNVQQMNSMLNNSGLSTANYDATLIGWSTLNPGETQIPVGVRLDATGLTYCAGESSRDLLKSATYNWTISGDASDCSSPTARTVDESEIVQTIDEESNTFKLILYPNPSDQYFNLEQPGLVGSSLVIYDIKGQQVLRIGSIDNDKITINTSQFPSGIYAIRIISEDSIIERKLIIRH